jgi:hypothetical protein
METHDIFISKQEKKREPLEKYFNKLIAMNINITDLA